MPTAERVYAMLGNETLWDTAARCHQILSAAEIPYVVCGGVAVCLHGYQRNTVDLDLVVRPDDADQVRTEFVSAGLIWQPESKEFKTAAGIAVQFLLAGDRAGKGSDVSVPVPIGDLNVETREGLSVVRLSKLIEMKLACGSANVRRTHKDFADVVELIAIRNLDSGFSQYLHPSLRDTFRTLIRNARGDE